jgi:hypothetical protein
MRRMGTDYSVIGPCNGSQGKYVCTCSRADEKHGRFLAKCPFEAAHCLFGIDVITISYAVPIVGTLNCLKYDRVNPRVIVTGKSSVTHFSLSTSRFPSYTAVKTVFWNLVKIV